jgi:tripartite-type tricarboxylate transporter receptor subunit TctC
MYIHADLSTKGNEMRALRLPTALLAIFLCAVVTGAFAQSYPTEPVRLMVGFAPGGGTDVTARIFAQKVGEKLGQPMVVENRSGASGSIAADMVSKAKPDGYRLVLVASGTFIHGVLSTTVPYNIVRDFTPITFVTQAPLVLVTGPSVSVRNFNELMELARTKPGGLTYGSDGIGATSHLAGELFNTLGKVKLVHVPFKGNAEGLAAIVGGQVDLGFPSLATATPMLQAGKLRAIAVTSAQRSALLPDVPTLDELGLRGFDIVAWFGFEGPPGLPKPIVDKLNTAISEVARSPEIKEVVAKQGLEVHLRGPEQFAAYVREQAAVISQLGKDSSIKLE